MRNLGHHDRSRRLRVFYVRVKGQLFSVMASNRTQAELVAMDHLNEIRED